MVTLESVLTSFALRVWIAGCGKCVLVVILYISLNQEGVVDCR